MSLVDRIKNIILTPKTEWPVIALEPSSTSGLITGYVAPLAAVGAVAGFIGGTVVGYNTVFAGTYRMSFMAGLTGAILTFVMAIVGIFLVSFLINALAPTFGAEKNSAQAMKVAAYSFTPGLVAGALRILPTLGMIGGLLGLYGLYLLYLGLQSLMKAPKEKAIGYTAVVCICAIVVSFVAVTTAGLIGLGGAMGAGMLSGGTSSGSSADEVQFDKDSPLGKLQELGKAMEESNKKMEAAQKSGDSTAAANAAMESLGTLFGGGKRVDPLEIDQIKGFLPPTVAGLKKQGNGTAEKSGMGGFMLSRAEADYTDGGLKKVTVEISDSGGATGLMGLASWATIQTSKEDENGSERTSKVNGRMVHEKTSKNGADEYSIVIGERFVVTATSQDMGVDQLKAVVSGLDLAKLESMKDVGVQTK